METRYEYTRKPKRCPACTASSIATILYGYPDFSQKLESDMNAGRVVLGGCCVSDDDPAWQCTTCNTQIFRKGDRERMAKIHANSQNDPVGPTET